MPLLVVPVIMSGGSGTRLWPLSTAARPKQFHALATEATMIQETAARFRDAPAGMDFSAPIVIGSADHEALMREQLQAAGAPPALMVLEPQGRNTAATAALAALAVEQMFPDAAALLIPADHVIADIPAYHAAIAQAAGLVDDRIVTFGVAPDRPETGYGYIQRGPRLAEGVFEIEAFHEKPNAEKAQTYLDAGSYYWNAGMFFFRPALLLAEFAAAAPEILSATRAAWEAAERQGDAVHLDEGLFSRTPSAPIDTAVMEITKRGAVAPCSLGWADIGSWGELWRLAAKDTRGNALHGPVAMLDGGGCLIRADGVHVAAAGVQDLVIIATPEAVLVIPRERAQDVKALWELTRNRA